MNLPPDEIMRQMAKLAMEQATTTFADFADQFAADMRRGKYGDDISGPAALEIFAAAIRSRNAVMYPTPKQGS